MAGSIQEVWLGCPAPEAEARVWGCLEPELADVVCEYGARWGPGALAAEGVNTEE